MTHTLDRPVSAASRARRALTALLATVAMLAGGAVTATPAYAAPGTLTGVVTLPNDAPATNAEIALYTADGEWLGYDYTDGAGVYEFTSVDPGSYTLRIYDYSYSAPYQFLGGYDDLASATKFPVGDGQDVTQDVELTAGQTVTGTVTRANGGAHAERYVTLHRWVTDDGAPYWTSIGDDQTDESGAYEIEGVLPGTYTVEAEGDDEYVDQFYGNVYDEENAKRFTATTSAGATGIDVVVPQAGRLEGVIKGENGLGLDNVDVDVYRFETDAWDYVRTVSENDTGTDETGAYAVGGFRPGNYTLRFRADGYPEQYLGGVTTRGGAERFELTNGQTRNVSTTLRTTPFVSPAAVTVSVPGNKSRYGTAAQATVTVTSKKGTVAGDVSLTNDGETVGTAALAGGKATFALPAKLAVGKHTLKATFATKGDVQSGTSPDTAFTVTKAKSSIKAGANKAKTAVQVKVKSTVKAAGDVVLKRGKTVVDKAKLNKKGKATLSLQSLNAGKQKLRVVYQGSKKVASSSKKLKVKIA
jgi:hypothetical protein